MQRATRSVRGGPARECDEPAVGPRKYPPRPTAVSGLLFSLSNAMKDLRAYTHLTESLCLPSTMGEAVHQCAWRHARCVTVRLCLPLSTSPACSARDRELPGPRGQVHREPHHCAGEANWCENRPGGQEVILNVFVDVVGLLGGDATFRRDTLCGSASANSR